MTSNMDKLRDYLAEQQLDGFVIPRTDEYQSEYLAPYAERLAWLSGFTGSAGLAIVTLQHAVIFVDGRYTIQVKQQTDNSIFEYASLTDDAVKDWLHKHLKESDRLGYDPRLHTDSKLQIMVDACQRNGASLIAVTSNPVDQCWSEQPEPPCSNASAHPLQFSGESSISKRQRIGKQLKEQSAHALIVTLPECIAWVLNVRGEDTPCVPVVLSRAIVYADNRVDWCFAADRVAFDLTEHCGDTVKLINEAEFEFRLTSIAGNGHKVMVDRNTLPKKYFDLLTDHGAIVIYGNPIMEQKACKNSVELDNAHSVHIRDAVAVVNFLVWLGQAVDSEQVTELSAVDKLLAFRQQQPSFRDNSFDTISGFADNGAITHYKVTPESDKALEKNHLYLLDSGAQYPEGTTDVTRTLVLGEPTQEQKDNFTRVLQGHISLATCRFPEGTSGHQLDAFARRALWDVGLDYAHGTGHGVGSYLGVHEGPQSIATRPNSVALKPGMILSNEPGYYKEGEYGIRIENLVAVKKSEQLPGFLEFENLTMVPIDRNLIEVDLLSDKELDWVNHYHQQVYEKVSPHLSDVGVKQWLREATARIDADNDNH